MFFNGDGTPDTTDYSEDPIKVAALEMQATTAAFAQQKVQMAKSGLGALAGGMAPSPDALMSALNGGSVSVDPHAGLTRAEKIALLGELKKAQLAKQTIQEEDPSDMVDPLQELSKGAGEGSKGGKVVGHSANGEPIYDSAKRRGQIKKLSYDHMDHIDASTSDHPDVHRAKKEYAKEKEEVKAGGSPIPSSERKQIYLTALHAMGHLSKSEADPETNLDTDEMHLEKAFFSANTKDTITQAYQDLCKAIYSEADKYRDTPQAETALQKVIEYKTSLLELRKKNPSKSSSGNDYWSKTEALRENFYNDMDALEIQCLEGQKESMSKNKLEKSEGGGKGSGEGSRGGKVVGHTSGGKPIYAGDEKEKLSRKQKEAKIAGKLPKQNKSGSGANRMIMVSGGMATATGLPGYSNHKLSDMSDDHVQKLYDHLHKSNVSDLDDFIQKSQSTQEENKMENANEILNDFLMKSEGEGSKGGKVIGHTKGGKPVYAPSEEMIAHHRKPLGARSPEDVATAKKHLSDHMARHKDFDAKDHAQAAKMHAKFADNPDKLKGQSHMPEGAKTHEVMGLHSDIDHAHRLESKFSKSMDGQGGMPDAGDPPSKMPTGRRVVDGEDMEEVGKETGAQSPPAATVASTSQAESTSEDDLKKKTPKDADLEEEAGGNKMEKGNFIDWNSAADEGEYLRAQLTSQLMNKSMDVRMGIGVRSPKEIPATPFTMPNVYFQKGGAYAYVDSEDQRIEKAMERSGGHLQFSQGSQANFGAPVQHQSECGNCNALVKSYLSNCEECGVSLHGVERSETQGLQLSKSVSSALIPGAEDDILIG